MSDPALPLAPVGTEERIASIDVLRGVALLGILTINIWSFALPEEALESPRVWGGFTGADFLAWAGTHLLCEQKMMSIFSMLFGAGLLLQGRRAEARGRAGNRLTRRRLLWLLVFGLLHAYLLWDGDILVPYALCGLVVYRFRGLSPAKQILLGLAVFLVAVPLVGGLGLLMQYARTGTTPAQQELRPVVDLVSPGSDTDINDEIAMYRGNYQGLLRHRAGNSIWEETVGFVTWSGPRAGGLMLLGMGLMQMGVFSAARPFRFYAALTALGYGLGLPTVAWGAYQLIAHDFDGVYSYQIGGQFNYVGSLFVALGHVGAVMLLGKAGALPRLQARLAAVGRMAFSNYLMQTVLCTGLFYGWGFGLFARLGHAELLGVVAAVWLIQLTVSPLWLRCFRFGPMEWLWRSLTYGRWQPLLAGTAGAAEGRTEAAVAARADGEQGLADDAFGQF
jgi:uncharacterized protein